MFIKYVLIAILILLAASIMYDGVKRYLAQRKERRSLQSKQDEADSNDDHGDQAIKKL